MELNNCVKTKGLFRTNFYSFYEMLGMFGCIFVGMYAINNLLFGMGTALLGLALPGLINMTSVSMALKRGLLSGMLYSFGGATTIFIQALIGVTFAKYLAEHLDVFTSLRKVAIVIFIMLSAFFLYQALNPKVKEASKRTGTSFLVGVAIASLNVLNIPFYFTSGTFLQSGGWVRLAQPLGWLYVAGVALGAFLGLAAYAYFAQYIDRKAQYFVRNLNYFLSGLFVILAIVQIVEVYF